MMKIKPAEGKAIRDPFTMQLLAPEGEEKPRNSFWLRRLADGDVVEVTDDGTGDVADADVDAEDDAGAAPKKRSNSK
ncbi:DUF2635 domain-containing protein [Escherichia coli]|uniref:DUF2635 domain-containing protein n=1 Tax=Escherichia coli TaxID=562 RepID=UPI0013319824|nr:DUF2635 domain-containing protein [Escherichia coli]EGM7825835.1 DUF2635 domain-containing protein [Escherichia coli]EJI1470017.1 DUF2635 domain-containing protein [Escherichia coli]